MARGFIALDEAKSELIIEKRGLIKKYPFSEIRSWKISTDGTGEYVKRNGLYVDVKDIDHPQWHLFMYNDNARRWFEILNQKINRD